MLVVPPVLTLAGYLIYRARYRIDEAMDARIVAELRGGADNSPEAGTRPVGAGREP